MDLTPKQSEAIASKARYKVLNWGRRCFNPSTRVLTVDGYKAIKDITVDDVVASFNTNTKQLENKKVLANHSFGASYDPKPMLELEIYGKRIKSTYDHEFYHNGKWVPAYQLAWGNMEASQRVQLELLCQQYGKDLNYEPSRWWKNFCNETGGRQSWIYKDSNEWEDCEGSSCCCADMDREYPQQTTSESYRQQPKQQCCRESGMGDTYGECSTQCETRSTECELGGKVWYTHTQGATSNGYKEDTTEQTESISSQSVEGTLDNIPNQSRLDSRHFERQELEAYCIAVLPSQMTHDLSVEDNHNYIVEDILVHNSGKTTLFAYEALGTALTIPGAKVTYYAQTFDDARTIAWDIFLDVFGGSVIKKNETRLEITVKNLSGGTSLVSLKGWESVATKQKGRGTEKDLLLMDEVAFCRGFSERWDNVLDATLLTSKGRAVFGSTPNGFNDFYDLANKAQQNKFGEWFYSHATSYDNPFNDPEWLDKKSKELLPDRWAQEYMADFRKQEGLVYKEFDRHLHVYDEKQFESVAYLGGIDFGFRNPTAILSIKRDKRGVYYVTDEYYKSEKTAVQIAEIVAERGYEKVYPDPADPAAIRELSDRRVNVYEVNKGKGSVNTGIDKIRELLKQQRLKIHSSCTNLIWEFEQYHYEKERDERNDSENPVKEHDHALDALSYVIRMDASQPEIKDYRTFTGMIQRSNEKKKNPAR